MVPARLLFLTERFRPDLGGVARSAARLAHALASLPEIEAVEVLCLDRNLPPGKLESRDEGGLAVHRFGPFGEDDRTLQHLGVVTDWLLGQRPFRILFGHWIGPLTFFGVLVAKRHGLASVISARGNDVDRQMFPPGDLARLSFCVGAADTVTAVSADLARTLETLTGRTGIVVLPNSVDPAIFAVGRQPGDDLRRSLGLEAETTLLAFSGELRHKKGMAFLLPALLRVSRQRRAALLIIGRVRGSERAEWERTLGFFLGAGGAANAVHITEEIEDERDIARHVRQVDLVLVPSLWDGMPNAVLEAQALGVPVVASDAGGIPEIVEHDVTGWLVPRWHLHRLGEACLELLSDPTRMARIAQAARDRVLAQFSPEGERSRLGAVVRGTLGDREAVGDATTVLG